MNLFFLHSHIQHDFVHKTEIFRLIKITCLFYTKMETLKRSKGLYEKYVVNLYLLHNFLYSFVFIQQIYFI